MGNAPRDTYSDDESSDANNKQVTFYYLPESTGWIPNLGGHPTRIWLPRIQATAGTFGLQTNEFGFTTTWVNDRVLVVDACTNLTNPNWAPVLTNILTDGSAYFSDPKWTNHTDRFYRLRTP